MTLRYLVARPSAFIPILMSLAAVGILVWALAVGVSRPADGDEGAAARIWQLLMVGQLPLIAYFALRWLPVARRPVLVVLVVQLGAALVSIIPVFMLQL